MAEIKSALQIALEKTENVKADKESVKAHEIRQEGQKIASGAFSDPEFDAEKALKKYSGKEAEWLKEGFLQTVISNVTLPADENGMERLERIQSTLGVLVKDKKRLSYIQQQLQKFFSQYLADRKRLEEALKQQFAGKLRQKEEQLSRQVGTQVHLRPESDPEFMNALKQNQGQLDEQYNQVLDQVKQDMKSMFSGA